MENIHPIFDSMLQPQDKHRVLGHKGLVIWFVGLSGSGKSTLARTLEQELHQRNILTQILDGDNLRSGLNGNLTFSQEDRLENIRRASEVAKLFMNCGVVTICSFISPTQSVRKMAREIIGEEDFVEVFVKCPLEVCETRDVKGLYKKARSGQIKDFTGIDSAFEAPENPEVEVRTDQEDLETSLRKVVTELVPRLQLLDKSE